MAWKKNKRTNYGFKLILQDLWGKYARKISNHGINKHECKIRDHDEVLHRVHSSAIYRNYLQEKRKREGFPHKVKEVKKKEFLEPENY